VGTVVVLRILFLQWGPGLLRLCEHCTPRCCLSPPDETRGQGASVFDLWPLGQACVIYWRRLGEARATDEFPRSPDLFGKTVLLSWLAFLGFPAIITAQSCILSVALDSLRLLRIVYSFSNGLLCSGSHLRQACCSHGSNRCLRWDGCCDPARVGAWKGQAFPREAVASFARSFIWLPRGALAWSILLIASLLSSSGCARTGSKMSALMAVMRPHGGRSSSTERKLVRTMTPAKFG
jgi:hypothetical protein